MEIMKRYFISAAAALLFISSSSIAQDNKDTKPGKLNEYDEIVIKRKNADKNAKVTIEIKDDQVLVDGKPLDSYDNEDVSVRKRNINRYRLNAPGSPFRFDDGNWSMENEDMMNGGNRAFLGVTTEGTSSGVRVTSVSENSAAAKAGLKKDDIITKVNDKAVSDHEELSATIAEFKPDDKVTITYKRDGKENKTTATLGKRRDPMVAGMPRPPMPPNAPIPPMPPMVFNFDDGEMGDIMQFHNKPRLGLKVQDTEDGKGVKVLDVEEGSAADKAGIKENDVITSFEGKDVSSAGDLAKASRDAKDKSALKVQLNRNGKPQTIEVKVPKKLRTANL